MRFKSPTRAQPWAPIPANTVPPDAAAFPSRGLYLPSPARPMDAVFVQRPGRCRLDVPRLMASPGGQDRPGETAPTLPTLLPTFFFKNIIYLCIIKKSRHFNQ